MNEVITMDTNNKHIYDVQVDKNNDLYVDAYGFDPTFEEIDICENAIADGFVSMDKIYETIKNSIKE